MVEGAGIPTTAHATIGKPTHPALAPTPTPSPTTTPQPLATTTRRRQHHAAPTDPIAMAADTTDMSAVAIGAAADDTIANHSHHY